MAFTVTELVARLKRAVELESGNPCCVTGEIGSCKTASSGHIYFTLKDENAQLSCALYAFRAHALRTPLREGAQVEIYGRATVWEGRGSLQFIVDRVKEAGVGILQQQFEALKIRLAAEGLFDNTRKLPIPSFPQSVALITSEKGAVIQDMRHRLESRAPWMQAWLYPVPVQGKGAEHTIARAVEQMGNPEQYGLPRVDYLIVARGGGSLEDLWCFNEEVLARAIANCPLPVVSAVGHETDFTIADFVADLRAPTPTAAIEMTTPDAAELDARLRQRGEQLRRRMSSALQMARLRLRVAEQSPLRDPMSSLAPYAQKLDVLTEELSSSCRERLRRVSATLDAAKACFSTRRLRERHAAASRQLESAAARMAQSACHRLGHLRALLDTQAARLSAADPQRALERGFALVRGEDGKLIRDAVALRAGQALNIRLARGSADAVVKRTHPS